MAFKKKSKPAFGYREMAADLKAGVIHNVYVISGEEEYLKELLLKKLETLLIQPGCESLDLVRFRHRSDPELFASEVETVSFMSERRVIEIFDSKFFSGTKSSESSQEKVIELLQSANSGSCLVFIEDTVDKRYKKLLNTLKEVGGIHVEVEKQEADELKRWLVSLCDKAKLKISAKAAEVLLDRCDYDMRSIYMETKKIFAWCHYRNEASISEDLVTSFCRETIRGSVFTLTDYIAQGKIQDALALLEDLVQRKEALTLIQFMLARHVRQLICAKDLRSSDAIASELKLAPFIANKLASQARRFSMTQLEALYRSIFENDFKMKRGLINDRVALELLLVQGILPPS